MIQVALTLVLILLGVAAYFYGAYKLAKYGFRLSTGIGVAVLLFPPYTFYFAFKKLEVDGKELPTAMVSFGLVLAILLTVVFSYELKLAVTGQFDELEELMTVDLDPGAADRAAIAEAMAAGREDRIAADDDSQVIADEIRDEKEAQQDAADADDEDSDDDADDEGGDADDEGGDDDDEGGDDDDEELEDEE